MLIFCSQGKVIIIFRKYQVKYGPVRWEFFMAFLFILHYMFNIFLLIILFIIKDGKKTDFKKMLDSVLILLFNSVFMNGRG
jgi:hypothetical protein